MGRHQVLWRLFPVGEATAMNFDRLLEGLNVDVSAFAICEVHRDASLVVQDDKAVSVHYVLAGQGLAHTMKGEEISLAPHTVVIAPPGTCLVVSVERQRGLNLPLPKCEPLPGGWERFIVGDGAPGIVLACGAVRATHRHAGGVFDYLRAPLVERVADEPTFLRPFQQLLDELAAPKPGTRALAEALMKQCLIVLLRRHYESGECRAPWLAALDDRRLGAAVEAMLDRPDAPFTLQQLADLAGMSRAAFAAHFRDTFGRPAMAFLKDLRLRRAGDLLAATDLPVKTIAARVGFGSRSHFSRAFKAFAGADPATYRANAARGGGRDGADNGGVRLA